jgi:hypothetical protein
MCSESILEGLHELITKVVDTDEDSVIIANSYTALRTKRPKTEKFEHINTDMGDRKRVMTNVQPAVTGEDAGPVILEVRRRVRVIEETIYVVHPPVERPEGKNDVVILDSGDNCGIQVPEVATTHYIVHTTY